MKIDLEQKFNTSTILIFAGIFFIIMPLFASNLMQVVLYQDGFETGTLSGYNILQSAGEICSVQTNIVYEGSYSAIFSTNASTINEYAYIQKELGDQTNVEVEVAFRLETAFTNIGDYIDLISFLGDAGSVAHIVVIYTDSGIQWQLISRLGSTSLTGVITTGTWYVTKLTAEMGVVDGQIRFYVNDVLTFTQQGDLTASGNNKMHAIRLGILYHWKMNPALTVYMDSLTIEQMEAQPPPTEYTLTIQSANGGSTNPVVGQHSYTAGTQVTVTATESANYDFESWILDGATVGVGVNPYIVTMTSNHTLQPVFVEESVIPVNYTLLINSQPISNVQYTIGTSQAITGSSVSLNEGAYTIIMPSTTNSQGKTYTFNRWIDTNGTNPQRSISLTSNLQFTVEYKLQTTPPPSSNEADLEIHAFAGQNEVNAKVTIDSTNYETTTNGITLILEAGTYTVTATWENQSKTEYVTLASGEAKRLDIQFSVEATTTTTPSTTGSPEISMPSLDQIFVFQLTGGFLIVAGLYMRRKEAKQ